jgi:ATP-binding protein involved in chromosome partitioning
MTPWPEAQTTMPEVTERDVLAALATVKDFEGGRDIVSARMVSGVAIKGGNVQFIVEVAPDRGRQAEPLRKAAEAAVGRLPGVTSVTAVLTAERAAPAPAPHAAPRREAALLPQVKSIVAVASGKGGVGKSTTAINIALALAQAGHKTGILDADIYGPSLPLLLAIDEKPKSKDGKKILPIVKYGIECMSIGFLVPADTPTIWRGPMVMGALQQMMGDVEWSPLDIMIVDMPPGTGDAQLTMAQRVPLAGAVIVSTPQDLALIDARKGLNMFRKVDVPVLGVVENMSYFVCPHCGERSDIFTHGGARRAAETMGVPFLGEIPLDMAIREASDAGKPIVVAQPDGAHAAAYRAIAEQIWNAVSGEGVRRPAPRIVVR